MKRKLLINSKFFFFIFLIILTQAHAEKSNEINPNLNKNLVSDSLFASKSGKFPIEKNIWINMFHVHFKKDFCEQSEWLKTCYGASDEDCQNLVTEKIIRCIPNPERVFPIKNEVNSKLLASQVGECLGEKFQEKYPLKNKEVDLCYLSLF